MAFPLLILIPAAIAAVSGVGVGIHGGAKMKRANKKIKEAKNRDKANLARLEQTNITCCTIMDQLGVHEMEILASFGEFSALFERLHNRPVFNDLKIGNVSIPKFSKKEIEDASVGANVLLGGLSSAALGTAGAFAASSATTAAVMALGTTASTGVAISSLSGVAATNATLAALGGGSIAAGGGGMALGSIVLGGATLGVGLLIGGVIFSVAGSHIEGKANKAYKAMEENEREINRINIFLNDLTRTGRKYDSALMQVNGIYRNRMATFRSFMNTFPEVDVDWKKLTEKQKAIVENLVLMVGLLYKMCKVQLVKQNSTTTGLNRVNHKDVDDAINRASSVLE